MLGQRRSAHMEMDGHLLILPLTIHLDWVYDAPSQNLQRIVHQTVPILYRRVFGVHWPHVEPATGISWAKLLGKPRKESFVNKSVQQMGDEIDPVWASVLASKGVCHMVRGCSWSVWWPLASPVHNKMSIVIESIGGFAHLQMVLSFILSRAESSLDVLASQRVTYWSSLYFSIFWL